MFNTMIVACQVVEKTCSFAYSKLMFAVEDDEAFAQLASAMEVGDIPDKSADALLALHELCKDFYSKTGTRLRLGFDMDLGPVWRLPNAYRVTLAPEVEALQKEHGDNIKDIAPRTRKVVRLTNGLFVKDWQYSQGHFDIVDTEDPLEACNIPEQAFKTFFKRQGGEHLTLTVRHTLT